MLLIVILRGWLCGGRSLNQCLEDAQERIGRNGTITDSTTTTTHIFLLVIVVSLSSSRRFPLPLLHSCVFLLAGLRSRYVDVLRRTGRREYEDSGSTVPFGGRRSIPVSRARTSRSRIFSLRNRSGFRSPHGTRVTSCTSSAKSWLSMRVWRIRPTKSTVPWSGANPCSAPGSATESHFRTPGVRCFED